jgi:secondary thiamine-phosphate synthase enzyme
MCRRYFCIRRQAVKILTDKILLETKGAGDLIDITDRIVELLKETKLQTGQVTVFHIGSTAAITTFEFEPGLKEDMQDLYEKIVPAKEHYHHDDTWNDANGFSHLRAALQGPSLTIPFENSKLLLGKWQQVVLAEFDNKPRSRRVVVQIIGE